MVERPVGSGIGGGVIVVNEKGETREVQASVIGEPDDPGRKAFAGGARGEQIDLAVRARQRELARLEKLRKEAERKRQEEERKKKEAETLERLKQARELAERQALVERVAELKGIRRDNINQGIELAIINQSKGKPLTDSQRLALRTGQIQTLRKEAGTFGKNLGEIEERNILKKFIEDSERQTSSDKATIQKTEIVNAVLPANQPTAFLDKLSEDIRETKSRALTKELRGEKLTIKEQLASSPVGGFGFSFIQSAKFGKSLLTEPIKTSKQVKSGLIGVKERITTGKGFPEVSQKIRDEPGFLVGQVTGEALIGKGVGKVASETTRLSKLGLTITSPKFKNIETTPSGERFIKNVIDKENVIKEDIGLIPRGKGIKKGKTPATLRGAFGFTKKEQASIIGKKGIVITTARDLTGFLAKGKKDLFGKKIEIGEGEDNFGLFATPFDPITGKPITRISRIGSKQKEASLLDILKGEDITFKKSKSEFIVFPEQTIGKKFKPFGKRLNKNTPTSELEVTLPPQSVIQIEKTIGKTIVEGEPINIKQAKVLDESNLNIINKQNFEKLLRSNRKNLDKPNINKTNGTSSSNLELPKRISRGNIAGRLFTKGRRTRRDTNIKRTSVIRNIREDNIRRQLGLFSRRIDRQPIKRKRIFRGAIRKTIPPATLPPSIPKPPKPPTIFGKGKKQTSNLFNKSFLVELRRRGEFKPIGKTRGLQRAINIGKESTLQTLARTFRVTPLGKQSVTSKSFSLSSSLFRKPKGRSKLRDKPFTFIQRRSKSLITQAERTAIQQARLSKQLNKPLLT